MKTKLVLTILGSVSLLSYPGVNFAQTPNLGSAANFALFSSVGAVSNTGISQITGNVGTNVGAVSGFGNVNGAMHIGDAATAQAAIGRWRLPISAALQATMTESPIVEIYVYRSARD